MLLLTALLATPTAEAKPADWNKCTVNGDAFWATSAQCTCMRAKGDSTDWWLTHAANVSADSRDHQTHAALNGSCFEVTAVLGSAYTGATESQLIGHAENISFSKTTNLVTGKTNGQYKFIDGYPETVIWAENGSLLENPPELLPFPWDPDTWEVWQDGVLVATVTGEQGDVPSHAMLGDWDGDQMLDVTVVWDSGLVYDLHEINNPHAPFTPPMGPPQ